MASGSPSNSPTGSPTVTPPDVRNPRKRAMTADLKSPKPERTPQDYDRIRVQRGLAYAEQRLNSQTRKPSPNTEILLSIYKTTCTTWLEQDSVGWKDSRAQNKIASQIRQFEKAMSDSTWIHAAASDEQQQLQDQLIDLRRQSFYARYGDWSKQDFARLKMSAKLAEDDIREKLNHLDAIALSAALDSERPAWICRPNPESENTPRTFAVWKVCQDVNMDFSETVHAIHHYAQRNSFVHNRWANLLKARRYDDLKILIFKDLQDLPNVIAPLRKGELQWLQTKLNVMAMRWWNCVDPDNPQAWSMKFESGSNATSLEVDRDTLLEEERIAREGASQRQEDLATRIAAKTGHEVAHKRKRDELWTQAQEGSARVKSGSVLSIEEMGDGPILTPKKGRVSNFDKRLETRQRAFELIQGQRKGVKKALDDWQIAVKDRDDADAKMIHRRDATINMQSEMNRIVSEVKQKEWYGQSNTVGSASVRDQPPTTPTKVRTTPSS